MRDGAFPAGGGMDPAPSSTSGQTPVAVKTDFSFVLF